MSVHTVPARFRVERHVVPARFHVDVGQMKARVINPCESPFHLCRASDVPNLLSPSFNLFIGSFH